GRGAVTGGPGGAFGIVVVAAVVVVGAVVVATVVEVASVVVSAVDSAALCSFGSAPKTSTAASIPKKNTKVTTMKARRPCPGNCGRKRGNRNDDASAKRMKAAPTTARPTLWPVERASSTREVHQTIT